MKLLLDTHIWLWGILEPERLRPGMTEVLDDPSVELWLSPVSVWEALLLADKGRVDLGPQPTRFVNDTLRADPMRDAPLTRAVAIASRSLSLDHEDPADRFLVATACVYDLTLVTADERILAAGACPTLGPPG